MINVRQMLRNRVIWQNFVTGKNRHDLVATVVNTVWKSYVRACSEIPNVAINKRDTEQDVQYFRNVALELHSKFEEDSADIKSRPAEYSDKSREVASDYEAQQNQFSEHSNEHLSANSTITVTKKEFCPQPLTFDPLNPLAKGDVKLGDVPINFPPSFNLAAYVNNSTTLQQLVKLGVDLSRWEDMKDIPEYIIKLDFQKDMQSHIQFLYDHGVPASELGTVLTKNPLIFKQEIDDLKVRINYLMSKKFSSEAIARILTKAPYFIIFSTKEIDRRLGYLQKQFHLTGDELRDVVTRLPKLPLQKLFLFQAKQFALKEEMGFNQQEIKCLFLAKPKLWLLEKRSLMERFHYIHNDMGLSHDIIAKFPEALLSRRFIINQRHLFLQELGRAQYDPKKEGYVSLKALVAGNDSDFCANVAKSSVKKFNEFLKTL